MPVRDPASAPSWVVAVAVARQPVHLPVRQPNGVDVAAPRASSFAVVLCVGESGPTGIEGTEREVPQLQNDSSASGGDFEHGEARLVQQRESSALRRPHHTDVADRSRLAADEVHKLDGTEPAAPRGQRVRQPVAVRRQRRRISHPRDPAGMRRIGVCDPDRRFPAVDALVGECRAAERWDRRRVLRGPGSHRQRQRGGETEGATRP